ncbi:trans-aconitate 2-methyltransferase [Streptomyces sp. DvalAA-14]|uniref:class I SAM-dependent methyltransferase n=1 Tax=unclassified Streptomyces TaxID=2593676 RepID=UPI00081B1C6A|nr:MULTISPECIES: class I SAM-dependent methyltransferase [unclassified Streptomyces]MYS19657.1 methyltransferase domain-containing protein [Streptomyces sp. SID4948]SCD49875.1 trans-aconitate 2-methyltransferase [Streptomyces sp. DvalAA-14]
MPREWDATTYDSLPLPHLGWGLRTLGRLPLRGDERVLDAGCGTGRDTAGLLDRLPAGRVVAVDASVRMLDQLRTRLAGRLDRVEVVRADLTEPLPFTGEVDAVFSVAAFHWIEDHAALFGSLASRMRPGARLVAECGGLGNILAVNAAVAEVLGAGPEQRTWEFAGVEQTRARLAAASFTDIDVRLRPDPARFEPGGQLEAFLATVVLGAHLDDMPAGDRAPFVAAVAGRLAEPVVDYVRLEISATRA